MSKLSSDIDRGLEIIAQMEALKEELDIIEERVKGIAIEGEQVELTDPEREGTQFLAAGSEVTVPVVFTADLLEQSFADGSRTHARIAAAAVEKLPLFYRPTVTWEMIPKNGKAFRREASSLLGAEAPSFITACLKRDKFGVPKSAIKIEWKRAHESALVAKV